MSHIYRYFGDYKHQRQGRGDFLRTLARAKNVKITTTYTLKAGDSHIDLSTTVENVGETTYKMTSGYGVSMSGMQTYLPGYGAVANGMYSLHSAETLPLSWVGGYNENKGTYGFYFPTMTHFTAFDTWVDPFRKIVLNPGEKVVENASFYIWEQKDVSLPLSKYYERNNITTGTLSGTVKTTSGQIVEKPYVNIAKDGKLIVTVRGNKDGEFKLQLAAGQYSVDAGLKSYSQNEAVNVTVDKETKTTLTYSKVKDPGIVTLNTKTGNKGNIPAQILIYSKRKFRSTLYTGFNGNAQLTMPPGEYRLELVYGDGYTAPEIQKNITVVSNETTSINVTFHKVFYPNTRNYYTTDLHHHSNILDGTTPPKDLVKSFMASGLDLTFVSDHNAVANHQIINELSKKHGLPFIPSVEITTEKWGHFNAYPLNLGELPIHTGKPKEFFQDTRDKGATFIQVNHPNTGGSYFDRTVTLKDNKLSFTKGYYGGFDGIEINGAWDFDGIPTTRKLSRKLTSSGIKAKNTPR